MALHGLFHRLPPRLRYNLTFYEGPNERFLARLPSWYHLLGGIERRMAARHRNQRAKINIAVTGSNGKTTTTHILHKILQSKMSAAKSHRNTHRGVFRSALKLKENVDCFVQEVAGGNPGALASVLKTFSYDGAIITTVGPDHWFCFTNKPDTGNELIAAEKAKLIQTVKQGGFVCLNGDDEHVAQMAVPDGIKKIMFGRGAQYDVRAQNIAFNDDGFLCFEAVAGNETAWIETRYFGTLMLSNFLCAIAAAMELGVSLSEAAAAIKKIEPYLRRNTHHHGKITGHHYYSDTYKAPLWSTKLLVEDLPNFKADRRIFVLGQFTYRSPNTPRDIKDILLRARENCDLVIATDVVALHAQKLIDGGVDRIVAAPSPAEVHACLRTQPPALVVLKCDWFSKMERIWMMEEGAVQCQRWTCTMDRLCYECDKRDIPFVENRKLPLW